MSHTQHIIGYFRDSLPSYLTGAKTGLPNQSFGRY